MTDRERWAIVTAILFTLLAVVVWLVVVDAPIVRFVLRLYRDKKFLNDTVRSWGWMAPIVFIAIQARQGIISYLFGISRMPFWIFAAAPTVARIPGTWVSSYFGPHVAEQQYTYAIAFLAVVVALCLPLYYYRERFIKRLHKPRADKGKA